MDDRIYTGARTGRCSNGGTHIVEIEFHEPYRHEVKPRLKAIRSLIYHARLEREARFWLAFSDTALIQGMSPFW